MNKEWTVVAEAYDLLPNTRAGGDATWYFSGGPQRSVRENVVITALIGSAAGHKMPGPHRYFGSNAYVLNR